MPPYSSDGSETLAAPELVVLSEPQVKGISKIFNWDYQLFCFAEPIL
jgi:hypothetical protein